jgi:FixJ family two-component response regulator
MPARDRSARVAIVEDNASMLRSIERLLTMEGFAVDAYGSAEAFLNRTTAGRIGCLIVDIQLPKMSGFELCRQLAEGPSETPVIFITASEDKALRQVAAELGCTAFLRKPFQPEALVGAVTDALGSA